MPAKRPSVDLSEDDIAYKFVTFQENFLRYDHTKGRWFLWYDTHWKSDETGEAFDRIRDYCVSHAASADTKATARRLTSAKHAKAIETFAQVDRRIAVSARNWDADPFLLATPAGTVNLKTGFMREPRPDDMISRITAIGPASSECPQWHKFLDEACAGNEDQITFLQKMCGYALTGDTREHALFFIYGPGGNGKSVFLSTLTSILRDYATTAPMESFTKSRSDAHPTDLAMLAGARLVTASETEEGKRWAEARIKALTGGDPISARFMREDFFTFRPIFKLLIVGNHMPALNTVDDAARRRFRLVPFDNKPTLVDKELEAKLRPEWPAILRWMIDGCLMWQGTGLEPPENIRSATNNYFSEQDILQQWLDDRCDLDINARVDTTLAFIDWQHFATKAGEFIGTKTRLTQSLEKKGIIVKPATIDGKSVRAYHRMKLRFTPTSRAD